MKQIRNHRLNKLSQRRPKENQPEHPEIARLFPIKIAEAKKHMAWIKEFAVITVTDDQTTESLLVLVREVRQSWIVLVFKEEDSTLYSAYEKDQVLMILEGDMPQRANLPASRLAGISESILLDNLDTVTPAEAAQRVGGFFLNIVVVSRDGAPVAVADITRRRGSTGWIPDSTPADLKERRKAGSGFGRPPEQPHVEVAVPQASPPGSDWLGTPASANTAAIVDVFYATDRMRDSGCETKIRYTGDRCTHDGLEYGVCSVSIPEHHSLGQLERPHWWKFEFKWNPEKHVVLAEVNCLERDSFYSRISHRLAHSNELLVFIHGYNVTFEDAARRTAQIAFDLNFQGAPVLYSWPSCGKVEGYLADEATIDWTKPHLKQFLAELAATGARTIHLIAHSMGNRALIRVLSELSTAQQSRFNQVVLTAPDIDTGEFLQIAAAVQRISERITLYASSTDKAILASRTVHKYPRAGEAGKHLVITSGVDTIDATDVDTGFLAHSYFSEKRPLLSDMYNLISEGKPPAKRQGLSRRISLKGFYWKFRK